jgi:hypothetical protein
MTVFFPNSSMQNTSTQGGGPGFPGDAPVPNVAQIMNGNPQGSQDQPYGVYPPQPINGISTSGASAPAQMSNGQIPVNVQPSNANIAAGLDSLMAQMSRGQISLNQSNYGQPGALGPVIGQGPAPQGTNIVPLPTGFANAVLLPTIAPVQSPLATAASGGAIANGTYFVKVTAILPAGETATSNEQSIVTTGTSISTITVTWSAIAGATGYRVYFGTTSNIENVYAAEAASPVVFTAIPTLGGTPPPVGLVFPTYTGN